MLTLAICSSPAPLAQQLTSDHLRFRPDLGSATEHELARELARIRPDVLIADAEPPSAAIGAWRSAAGADPLALVLVAADRAPAPRLPTARAPRPERELPDAVPVYTVPRHDDPEQTLHAALAVAERHTLDARLARRPAPVPRPTGRRVLVVGAGVVNLVTAHTLQREGWDVTVLDAAPDPRAAAPWTAFGCSRGGGNARMFTLTEMDDYHAKSVADVDSNTVFDRPPAELGWDVRADRSRAGDAAWVEEFKAVPPWLASAYNADILGLNRRSGDLWDELERTRPQLFEDVELRHDILRLYQDPAHLAAATRRQRAVGALRAELTDRQVRDRFPALAGAVPGTFAGGVLVRGFTVNVHDFMAALLDDLEERGAQLRFGSRAERVLRTPHGQVGGILTDGGPLTADHYVLSPGVTGEALLDGTAARGQVHGVLGCWATVPNLEPALANSLKVARRGHIAEDANVTVGRDSTGAPVLMVGSGYGWTGADPANIDPERIAAIHDAIADTVRRLFPAAYDAVGGREGLRRTEKHCVRPWTASNLGLFTTEPAARGALVVTGGHNTGGFAQAPVIAEAVAAAISGRHHPMHHLYHPLRTRDALERRPVPAATAALAA
jgi:D-amino-acid dehydrogenase